MTTFYEIMMTYLDCVEDKCAEKSDNVGMIAAEAARQLVDMLNVRCVYIDKDGNTLLATETLKFEDVAKQAVERLKLYMETAYICALNMTGRV